MFFKSHVLPFLAWFLVVTVVAPVGVHIAMSKSYAGTALTVAVASNFLFTAQQLRDDFGIGAPGVSVHLVSGSTGKLYAQIVHGAPFHVFLAADTASPTKLGNVGLAIADSQFTYAEGVLVLAAKQGNAQPNGKTLLGLRKDKKLALAQPALAPYGRAAEQSMEAMQVLHTLRPQLVYGESVVQAQQFLAAGVVDVAFIARPQAIIARPQATIARPQSSIARPQAGTAEPYAQTLLFWEVPQAYYTSIAQDAVMLTPGAALPAAGKFMTYLRSARAQQIIENAGYKTRQETFYREPDTHASGVHR